MHLDYRAATLKVILHGDVVLESIESTEPTGQKYQQSMVMRSGDASGLRRAGFAINCYPITHDIGAEQRSSKKAYPAPYKSGRIRLLILYSFRLDKNGSILR